MLWQVWLFTVLAKKQSTFYSRGDIKQREERASQTVREAPENYSFFSLKAAFQRGKINSGALKMILKMGRGYVIRCPPINKRK